MASSIVHRVATGAALGASASALLAALATIVVAHILLQRADDRRLEEAAVTFAVELAMDGHDSASIAEVFRDESAEMDHTGMGFAVYDPSGNLLVGDSRLRLPPGVGCSTIHSSALRVCRAESANGLSAVVGGAHTPRTPLLAAAATLSALFAAAIAWAVSRPVSRYMVAHLRITVANWKLQCCYTTIQICL